MPLKFKGLTIAAVTLSLGLGAAACDSSKKDDKNLTIGVVSGWAEGEAATALW